MKSTRSIQVTPIGKPRLEEFEEVWAKKLDLDVLTEERAFLALAQWIFRRANVADAAVEKSIVRTVVNYNNKFLDDVGIKPMDLKQGFWVEV
jgi:hypothetical protein